MSLLSVAGLTKSYAGVQAVRDLSYRFPTVRSAG